MSTIIDEAIEILDIAKNIYQIQENNNPTAIFKDKTFEIMADGNVRVEIDYEEKDSSYYFEAQEIDGVIIKRGYGNYCIKASVKYINANNRNLWFAKIRIEASCDGDIQIRGKWGGSWEDEDFYDEDFIKNPNSDFPIALVSMKTHLDDIYNQLCNNGLNSDTYDSELVKKLKKYNN